MSLSVSLSISVSFSFSLALALALSLSLSLSGTFGHYLDPTYRGLINNFKSKYLLVQEYVDEVLDEDARLENKWKMHIFIIHLPEFLDIYGIGLAFLQSKL